MEPRTRNKLRFRFVRRATRISTNSDLEMEREREDLNSGNNHVKHFNYVKTQVPDLLRVSVKC